MIRQINDADMLRMVDPAPHLRAWLTDWPVVRDEVEKLIDIYLQSKPPPAHYATYAGYDQLLEHYHAVAQAIVDDAVSELREDGVQARAELRRRPAAEAII